MFQANFQPDTLIIIPMYSEVSDCLLAKKFNLIYVNKFNFNFKPSLHFSSVWNTQDWNNNMTSMPTLLPSTRVDVNFFDQHFLIQIKRIIVAWDPLVLSTMHCICLKENTINHIIFFFTILVKKDFNIEGSNIMLGIKKNE